MNTTNAKYYPTILKAIHLVILYIFIQSVIDFPLALYDYYNGTDYLYNPVKKIFLGVGSLAFLFYYAFKKTGTTSSELFPVKSFNVFILIPIFIFIWGAQNLIGVVNRGIDLILPPPPWFWELFNKVFESDFGIYGAFFKVVIIAPIVEELIFRGIIMYGLMRNYSSTTAIFTSALMFALFHLNPWQFPATFVLGSLLGFLMVRKRNILLCILGHAINNGIALFGGLVGEEISFLRSQTSLLIISFLAVMVSFVVIYIITKPNEPKPGNI